MKNRTVFRLEVTLINSVCSFKLNWGASQSITKELKYYKNLDVYYCKWQEAYLNCYQNFRGKGVVKGSGQVVNIKVPNITNNGITDYQKLLRDAEDCLINEFHEWLQSAKLSPIRREIANAASNLLELPNTWVELFITCNSIELRRLPWETWEIGEALRIPEKIRISRTPGNIRNKPVCPVRRKLRMLVIFGDDSGLDFKAEKQAVQSLDSIMSVKFAGWSREKYPEPFDIKKLKLDICQDIKDEKGWDILFFAGHSQENFFADGELGIAPNVFLPIREIKDSLEFAQSRGLQFAIFNSCCGTQIAEYLIDMGLNQVVVMREPIHDKVSWEFFKQFSQSLAEYKDVHSALLDTCQYLKQQEKRISYPSAYLVPSLFRHPEAEVFRIQPFGIWAIFKRWLPTQKETKWLGILLALSLISPVQNLLLEPRILLQAIYRQLTFQMPSPKEKTPILLVKIDEKSFSNDKIEQRYPIDYGYLANLIQKVSNYNAQLIGVNYVLNAERKQQEASNKKLQEVINKSVSGKNIVFVFAYYQKQEDSEKNTVSDTFAKLNWSLEGDIKFSEWYVQLPERSSYSPDSSYCSVDCPFSYLLALTHLYQTNNSNQYDLVKPNLESRNDFLRSLNKSHNISRKKAPFLYKLQGHQISDFAYWFYPIIDFSIPPNQVYQAISACELLGSCKVKTKMIGKLDNKIVIIAPGLYDEAGIDGKGEANQTIPLAVAFGRGKNGWRDWLNGEKTFTKGEAHAYMVNSLLARRIVTPIPDFLMILIAGILGKYIKFILLENPSEKESILNNLRNGSVVYLICSLQAYISLAILLPWFLPSITLWNYIRFAVEKKTND